MVQEDIEQGSEQTPVHRRLETLAKQALPHFYSIIRKVRTENLRLLDINEELTQISLVFRDIDRDCSSITVNRLFNGRALNLDHPKINKLPEYLEDISLMIQFYNAILTCYNTNAYHLKSLVEQEKFRIFNIFVDLETELDRLPLTTSAPLHAFSSLTRKDLHKGFVRFKKTENGIALLSYVLGGLSAKFFIGIAEKGAQLLPFEFMQNEDLAVASTYSVNFFLNGYFPKNVVITAWDATEETFVNLQKLFATKTTPELDLLNNLDPSRKAMLLRGLEQAWTLFFSGTLAVGSTVVIGLIDWRELHDAKQLIITCAVYLALHYEGSITLQHALWLSMQLFGLIPRVYRDKFYDERQKEKYSTLLAARAVHESYERILNSGFSNLIGNKTRFNSAEMRTIYGLTNTNTLESNAQLFFKIGQYADTPKESNTFHRGAGNTVRFIGQIAMFLSLLGYASFSLQTVEGSDESSHDVSSLIQMSTIISLTVFCAFYGVVGDATIKEFYATIGEFFQWMGMLWHQTETNAELLDEAVTGSGKSLVQGAYHYPRHVRERWERSTGIADFIQQNSLWLKLLLHPTTIFFGCESSAASLALNEESLNGFWNFIAYWPTILMTMVANFFAVGPVLKDIALTIFRACAMADDKKSEFILRDRQQSMMKLYKNTDPVIFLEMLWDIMQSIYEVMGDHEDAYEHAERVLQAIFIGQPVESVFGKDYCERYVTDSRKSPTPYVDTVTHMHKRLTRFGVFDHFEARKQQYFEAPRVDEATSLLP